MKFGQSEIYLFYTEIESTKQTNFLTRVEHEVSEWVSEWLGKEASSFLDLVNTQITWWFES